MQVIGGAGWRRHTPRALHRRALSVLAVGAGALALLVPWSAAEAGLSGEAMRLEAARANARAGGPVSEADADLLRRYGCLSGTDNDFCRRLEARDRAGVERRSKRWRSREN